MHSDSDDARNPTCIRHSASTHVPGTSLYVCTPRSPYVTRGGTAREVFRPFLIDLPPASVRGQKLV